MILYFYAIQHCAEAAELGMRYFHLASKCHAQIQSIATKGSLMQRYGVVLQELRLEVLRNNDYLAPVPTPARWDEEPSGYPSVVDGSRNRGQGELSAPLHATEQLQNMLRTGQPQMRDAARLESNGQREKSARGMSSALNRPAREGQPTAANYIEAPDASAWLGDEVLDNSAFLQMSGWGQFDSLVSPIQSTLASTIG